MARRVRKTVEKDGIIHSYRRVVKSGHSLLVSLPVAWVRRHGIMPGDVLVLSAGPHFLAMCPKPAERGDGGGR